MQTQQQESDAKFLVAAYLVKQADRIKFMVRVVEPMIREIEQYLAFWAEAKSK